MTAILRAGAELVREHIEAVWPLLCLGCAALTAALLVRFLADAIVYACEVTP